MLGIVRNWVQAVECGFVILAFWSPRHVNSAVGLMESKQPIELVCGTTNQLSKSSVSLLGMIGSDDTRFQSLAKGTNWLACLLSTRVTYANTSQCNSTLPVVKSKSTGEPHAVYSLMAVSATNFTFFNHYRVLNEVTEILVNAPSSLCSSSRL